MWSFLVFQQRKSKSFKTLMYMMLHVSSRNDESQFVMSVSNNVKVNLALTPWRTQSLLTLSDPLIYPAVAWMERTPPNRPTW